MSQENVEIVRAWTDAFNARDIEALIAPCDPQIDFHSTFAAVGGAFYHGHDGMRRWHRDQTEAWGEEIRSELETIFNVSQQTVLVFTVLHARGRHSGAEVALPAAIVARLLDGLIVYLKGYAHREDALRDLGVSEDALKPIAP